MNNRSLTRILYTVLALLTVVPTISLVAVPQKVHAIVPVADALVGTNTTVLAGTDPKKTADSSISAIENTITAIASVTTQAATYALYIKEYVLEPLAFVTSGNAIMSLTAGMLDFVSGKSNGTGQPQFVQNMLGHSQMLGDGQMNTFFIQFGRNSNSPFAGAINSSLRANYLEQSSLGGFFAANQCTLGDYSPNQRGYLNGNWSQGGAGAWLALTTQDQNNPYMLHMRAQAELSSMIREKTAARLNELAWGGGMLSWCGGDAAKNAKEIPVGEAGSDMTGPVIPKAGEEGGPQGPSAPEEAKAPAKPGDPCTNDDGTPGTIQTPGSSIKGYLDKSLGLNADKLTRMGNAAGQINQILGNLASIMSVANFATDVLGGPNGGGLAGASSGQNGRPAIYDYADNQLYGGFTMDKTNQSANNMASAQSLQNNTNQYESAWVAIKSAANTASAALNSIISTCAAPGDVATVAAAQGALADAGVIGKAHSDIAQAEAIIAAARGLIQKVQTGTATTQELSTVQSIRPSDLDVSLARTDAQATTKAVANPKGSLNISGGTLLDQLILVNTNALELQNSCNAAPATP